MSFSTKNPVRQRSGTGWNDLFSGISFEGRDPLRRPQSGANRRPCIVNPPPEIYPTRWHADMSSMSSSPRKGRFSRSRAWVCPGHGHDARGSVACLPTRHDLHPVFHGNCLCPSRCRCSCRGLNAVLLHVIRFSKGLIQRASSLFRVFMLQTRPPLAVDEQPRALMMSMILVFLDELSSKIACFSLH